MDVIRAIARDAATFGTSGNASARVPGCPDEFAITPSGIAWDATDEAQLVRLAVTDGTRTHGSCAPSTEWRFHANLYRAQAWVGGIVHLHSPYATVLSTVNVPVRPVHYQMVRVADEVPVVPYQTFGTAGLADAIVHAITPAVRAVLLQNHGLVAVGDTVADAYRAAQEVEWTALIQYRASLLGTPRVLTPDELDRVRESFAHYGQPPS